MDVESEKYMNDTKTQVIDEANLPKIEKLATILQKYFENEEVNKMESKAIVFIDHKVNIEDVMSKITPNKIEVYVENHTNFPIKRKLSFF